jgi:HlyD family secretion protein
VQSSVIGEIVDLPVKEGDVVKKGDLLVQIDRERYRTEVDRLESVVRTQRIAIEQAEVALANSQRQHKRNTSLFGNSGLVSQADLDRSELDLRQREIDLRSLQEQVAQAQASLARSRDDLSKTTIRSVIDGTVTKLNAEKGEITMTGTMNNAGTVIMIVSDMGEVLATVDVDETRVTQLQVGQAARVVVDAVGEAKPYTGKVVEIAGSAIQRPGQQTQVFEVKIALDTVDAKLRPGMTAKARVETQRLDKAVAIPIQAVMLRPSKDLEAKPGDAAKKDKDGTKEAAPVSIAAASSAGKTADTKECVYVVENGKAVLRAVTSGISDETSVAITSGLKDGETVVTGPYRALRDLKVGDPVKEKKSEDTKSKKDDEGKVQVEVD